MSRQSKVVPPRCGPPRQMIVWLLSSCSAATGSKEAELGKGFSIASEYFQKIGPSAKRPIAPNKNTARAPPRG
eukprot:6194811-Pleurochrysis_carterae.AAC.1